MSEYELPELPSDEELGITEEDRADVADGSSSDRPELSDQERTALLGTRTPGEPPVGVRPRGFRARWGGPVTLAVLVAVAVTSSAQTGLPRPVPATANDSTFSSARAMSMLEEIARRPRPTGSPEHARVRQYLMDRLRELGLDPELQTATSLIEEGGTIRAATVRNIVARSPGQSPTGAVLITAHYDSQPRSPGAGDDGAGIVAILESLRALGSRSRLRNDVIVLLTDGEELDLLGARVFTDQHPWMRDVSLVLSFDMRGASGPSIMYETNRQNGWIVGELARFDPHPVANSLALEVYRRMPNDTDFSPFRDNGKQGLNFAAIGRGRVYHQSTDTPENLSESTLQHLGARALAALEHFGQTDLSTVDGPDVVYVSLPFLGLLVYDSRWVLPISGALLLLATLVAVVATRRGARAGGIAAALGIAVLGGVLSYAFARALSGWIAGFHPEAGRLLGSLYHSEGWYVLAVTFAAFAIVSTLYLASRRWLSLVELSLGATLPPLLLATAAGFVAPLGALNLQWPVASALVSILVLALLGSRQEGWVGRTVSMALAVPVLAFLVPLLELLWMALTIRALGLIAVGVAVALHLSLPAMAALRRPNAWWAPLFGTTVCAATLGLGVLAARPTEARPAPSTLVYVYEHGTGAASWATDPDADSVHGRDARSWAVERAGSAFTGTRDLRRFGIPWNAAPVTDAPVVTAAPPEVVILRDTVDERRRHVTLGVRSRVGAERMIFERDSVARTRFLSLDGIPVERPGAVERIDYWGIPDSLAVLELDMAPEDAIGVHVIENLFHTDDVLGAGAFARPPDLAPDASAGSDRVVLRFSIAAFADPRHALLPPPTRRAPAPVTGAGLATSGDSASSGL